MALYDRLGRGYRRYRRPDARIGRAIVSALGDAATVVNVGAGAGAYEPRERWLIAVEPSLTMIRQRPRAAAPVVQATASQLPFRDGVFDAGHAILTIHHWSDQVAGLEEMARAARGRVVLLTWDPDAPRFWLTDDYFPEALTIDRAIFPTMDVLRRILGPIAVVPVPIPHDCSDGFLGAYWRRPEAYLDAGVRAAISTFWKLPDVDAGIERLRCDLASGEWVRRHGGVLSESALDLGYRVVASGRVR